MPDEQSRWVSEYPKLAAAGGKRDQVKPDARPDEHPSDECDEQVSIAGPRNHAAPHQVVQADRRDHNQYAKSKPPGHVRRVRAECAVRLAEPTCDLDQVRI